MRTTIDIPTGLYTELKARVANEQTSVKALILRGVQTWAWYQALPSNANLVFSRVSQLGLLRLSTTRAVALENTMTQAEAWGAYDRWLLEGGAIFAAEPFGVELELRALANPAQAAPRNWTDTYLAAFATTHSLQLVTFDKVLSRRCRRSVLLV